MLIKEYHIPLPLTLEEYRIAQLYMIQKKSREESEGEGSAVEILENHPYTDGPNGSGQYTYKVYHIGRHLPSWFRGIAPKTALEVHEESWNAYPYTKTVFKVPFVEKFSLEVETYFVQDGGTKENMFNLSPSELRSRELDVIDIVNNELSGNDYKKVEDPSLYCSQKTGRGPLKQDWISNPPKGVIMCAYKLIKVEFRYWGLQSKVERFIHDYGLRRVMLRAHRQAWAWQDEWVGLTIADIRRLERETQFILQKKLGRLPPDAVYKDDEDEQEKTESVQSAESESLTMADDEMSVDSVEPPKTSNDRTVDRQESHDSDRPKDRVRQRSHPSLRSRPVFSRRHSEQSTGGLRNPSDPCVRPNILDTKQASRGYESDDDSMYSTRVEWALDHIAMVSDDSDSEFFDAKESISEDEEGEEEPREMLESPPISTTQAPDDPVLPDLPAPLHGLDLATRLSASVTNLPGNERRSPLLGGTGKTRSLDYTGDYAGTPCVQDHRGLKPATTADILFLVFHGGSALDARKDHIGKAIDFQTISDNFKTIIDLHFPAAVGRVALRVVPCVNVCSQALQLLSQVSPSKDHPLNTSTRHKDSTYSFLETLREAPTHIPVGAVPLLATDHHGYTECLALVAATANKAYQQFLGSKEGERFSGQVCVLADCMGSVLAYDILASTHSSQSSPESTTHTLHPSHSPEATPHTLHPSHSPEATPHTLHPSHSSPRTSPSPERRGSSQSIDGKKLSTDTIPKALALSTSSLSSSSTSINVIDGDGSGFIFEVTHFFMFGSPLGVVLGSRRSKVKRDVSDPPPCPSCTSLYNLFYDCDPMASRLEPLLDQRFTEVAPIPLPSYRQYPTGMAKANSLMETVVQHPHLFGSHSLSPPQWDGCGLTRNKSLSSECLSAHRVNGKDVKPFTSWWSQLDSSRIDYLLESPQGAEGFHLLPQAAFSHIIHSRYWEAKELVSFMLRQVLRHDTVSLKVTTNDKELIPFIPLQRVSPWNRKTTAMKIKRLGPNHRVCDVLTVESGSPPTFTGKFQYGPLAVTSLCKEQVEVYLLHQTPKPKWDLYGTGETDKHGKMMFTLPEERSLPGGVYPAKFLVKGDHTTASCNLFVVPPHTEVAVFSVDGALASNFSISAKDMRVKPGAVETVRRWQERGYLLIYITGRPLIQKEHILSFLGAHRFPLGLVACADSLAPADSQSFKTMFLARLIKEAKLIIHVAYGSSRHLAGFKELGLQSDQIYIHGNKRSSKSSSCQYLLDGFASHLSSLNPRQASYDARKLMGDICFVLPGVPKSEELKRRSHKRSSNTDVDRNSLSLDSSKLCAVKAETVV